MKTRIQASSITLFSQSLMDSKNLLSHFNVGSAMKTSSLVLSAVLTLGLISAPAKADHTLPVEATRSATPHAVSSEETSAEIVQTAPVEAIAPATEPVELITTDPMVVEPAAPDTATTTTDVAPEATSEVAIDSMSSEDLLDQQVTDSATQTPGSTSTAPAPIAQSPTDPDTSDVDPGRSTRSGSSYIGIGGNIGVGDDDVAVGEGSFAIFSKIGLTSNISARPAVLFSDDPTILVPVTLDFSFGDTEPTEEASDEINLSLNPYIGAGVAISTGGDGSVDLLATGGLDIPITSRFTGTAAINAVFFDDVAIGVLLGVGYNF